MDALLWLCGPIMAGLLFYHYHRRSTLRRRQHAIETYTFPTTIARKVGEAYPHLSPDQVQLVMRGLRDYFHICNLARGRMVAMPSQVVDVAWHEFILFTRHYQHFCNKAIGRFLHHTPAEAMGSRRIAQAGIKRAWRIACLREKIPPRAPRRLPLLFALDADLDIPNGFRYSLNCKQSTRGDYCASHIGCSSSCGSGCGSGCGGGASHSDSSASDSGGGDSGGGCGGGGD